MTEQRGHVQETGAFRTSPVSGRDHGRIPDSDAETPHGTDILAGYRQNLDRLSVELDEYFSRRRLIPAE